MVPASLSFHRLGITGYNAFYVLVHSGVGGRRSIDMARFFRKLLLVCLGTLTASSAIAQQTIILKCEGELESSLDDRKDLKRTSIDVLINLTESTFEAEGFWGCLANLGEPFSVKSRCDGTLPLLVSDSEFRFGAKSSNDLYDASTVLVINRYTGMLTVNSSAIAKPAAKARWTLMLISGRSQCAPQAKRF